MCLWPLAAGRTRGALLCLGELGRRCDLSSLGATGPAAEAAIAAALASDSEDAKAAASLALGGVTCGNLSKCVLMPGGCGPMMLPPGMFYCAVQTRYESRAAVLAAWHRASWWRRCWAARAPRRPSAWRSVASHAATCPSAPLAWRRRTPARVLTWAK
jgi:hypothetical protein